MASSTRFISQDSFVSQLPSLRRQDLFKDVTFYTADNQCLKCHLLVLAAWSNDFLSNILVALKDDVHIVLPDFSSGAVQHFLDTIYGCQTNIKNQSLMQLLIRPPSIVKKEDITSPLVITKKDIDLEVDIKYDISDLEDGNLDDDDIGEKVDDEITETACIEEKLDWKCPLCEKNEEMMDFGHLMTHIEEGHKQYLKNKYVCERCAQAFKGKLELVHHTVTGKCVRLCGGTKKSYTCQLCPCSFHGIRNLQSHVWLQHADKCTAIMPKRWSTYFCEVCQKLFQTVIPLREHMSFIHGMYQMNFADQISYVLNNWKDEEPLVIKPDVEAKSDENKDKVFCSLCSKYLRSKASLTKHVKLHHQDKEEHHKCRRCDLIFPTRFGVFKHMRTCGRTLPCDQCDRMFYHEIGLERHKYLIHNDDCDSRRYVHEKVKLADGSVRFKCDLCSKLFMKNASVFRHKDGVHADKDAPKKLHCTIEGCTYQTNVGSNFDDHVASHGAKRYICPECGKAMSNSSSFRKHCIRVHSTESLMCEICSKLFSNRLTLQFHMKTHGEAIHKCKLCEKKFVTKGGLSTHMICHSNVIPFVCQCGKGFKRKSHLLRHCSTKRHDPETAIH